MKILNFWLQVQWNLYWEISELVRKRVKINLYSTGGYADRWHVNFVNVRSNNTHFLSINIMQQNLLHRHLISCITINIFYWILFFIENIEIWQFYRKWVCLWNKWSSGLIALVLKKRDSTFLTYCTDTRIDHSIWTTNLFVL